MEPDKPLIWGIREKKAFQFFALVLLANSIVRGIRSPGLWAGAHTLFNYSSGFTKRALIGEILRHIDRPIVYTYDFYFWTSLLVFSCHMAILIGLTVRSSYSSRKTYRLATLVYFSSVAVVALAGSLGFGEHFALVIASLAIAIRSFERRYVLVLVFFSVSLLIHEAAFLLLAPLIAYLFALDVSESFSRRKVALSLGLLTSFAVETQIVGSRRLSLESVDAMYQSVQSKADYPLMRGAFLVMSRDLKANLRMIGNVWTKGSFPTEWNATLVFPTYKRDFVESTLVSLPFVVFFVCLTIHILRRTNRPRWLIAVATAASLSPLAMHVVAWDHARWNPFAITTSFFVLLSTIRFLRTEDSLFEPATMRRIGQLSIGLIMFGLSVTIKLFDGRPTQSFPYLAHVDYWIDVAKGAQRFPYRPPEPVFRVGRASAK